MDHGKQRYGEISFSSRGIELCVEYFKKRGHDQVIAFLPRFRLKVGKSDDPTVLKKLEQSGNLICTPSREVDGKAITSYDDR